MGRNLLFSSTKSPSPWKLWFEQLYIQKLTSIDFIAFSVDLAERGKGWVILVDEPLL